MPRSRSSTVLEALLAVALVLGGASEARACPGGLDGTFVQFRGRQIEWRREHWVRVLDDFERLGLSTIVLQHSGDPHGSYESYDRTPITGLLEEADARGGFSIWIGLAHMPGWPDTVPDRLAPLADRRAVDQLARLCRDHPSCAGFYLSPEIDDQTWSGRERQLRRLLGSAIRTLRFRVPRARIAISPFFTRTLSPEDYAAWMTRLLSGLRVDVVMLQGGTGTGRFTAEDARAYFEPLAAALRARRMDAWLVVELFDQLSGPPVDARPFSAMPTDPEAMRAAMLEDVPAVRTRIAYTVLDYLDPRLRAAYLDHCRTLAVRASSR